MSPSGEVGNFRKGLILGGLVAQSATVSLLARRACQASDSVRYRFGIPCRDEDPRELSSFSRTLIDRTHIGDCGNETQNIRGERNARIDTVSLGLRLRTTRAPRRACCRSWPNSHWRQPRRRFFFGSRRKTSCARRRRSARARRENSALNERGLCVRDRVCFHTPTHRRAQVLLLAASGRGGSIARVFSRAFQRLNHGID